MVAHRPRTRDSASDNGDAGRSPRHRSPARQLHSVLRAESAEDARSVVVAEPRALAHVMREPSEIGLARARVDGSLTMDGALEDVLSTRHEFAGARLSIRDRVRLAPPGRSRQGYSSTTGALAT
jgi:hypothetical protein